MLTSDKYLNYVQFASLLITHQFCMFTEAMELHNWENSEDVQGTCQLKVQHSCHILNNKWEVHCQWFGGQLCLSVGSTKQEDSPKIGRPYRCRHWCLLSPTGEHDCIVCT